VKNLLSGDKKSLSHLKPPRTFEVLWTEEKEIRVFLFGGRTSRIEKIMVVATGSVPVPLLMADGDEAAVRRKRLSGLHL